MFLKFLLVFLSLIQHNLYICEKVLIISEFLNLVMQIIVQTVRTIQYII